LFLDEIGDMPLSLQPKLLRVLQERRFRPVGSNVELPLDARVITATHRDLESAVEEKGFRQDLYFRINVVRIDLPPLRSRGGDVLLLANRLLSRFATASGKELRAMSPTTAERLMAYDWPGNVRELSNCMERAVALARDGQIRPEYLPEKVSAARAGPEIGAPLDPAELPTLEEVERRYLHHVMTTLGGNKTRAARVLGLDRKPLYRKLARYSPE